MADRRRILPPAVCIFAPAPGVEGGRTDEEHESRSEKQRSTRQIDSAAQRRHPHQRERSRPRARDVLPENRAKKQPLCFMSGVADEQRLSVLFVQLNAST
jgi:hypothetical protein